MSSEPASAIPADTQKLAEKVLLYSRRYITQLAPLMLAPIYALRQKPVPVPSPMSTDGVHLFYSPEQVLADFQEDRCLPARQLLHVTLHCLMGHLPARPPEEKAAPFDLLADLKAAQLADALSPQFFPPGNTSILYHAIPPLPAMLQRLESRPDSLDLESLQNTLNLRKLCLDDHRLWNPPVRPEPGNVTPDQSGRAGDDGKEDRSDGTAGPAQEGAPEGDAPPNWNGLLQDLMHQAQNSPIWGSLSGALEAEFAAGPENQISYQDFLRRFAVPEERLLLDPDSFDPRWYCLGLELYGDIPLLEPAEISEPPLPDDIVLALDTSGSCSGEICSRFLRETLNLLRDISAGATRFRVLLLQCDSAIQKELFLESPDQLDHLLEDFTPSGFGGTDFCPVFDRVAQLQADGTLPKVRGLLYLSDGCGRFPEEAPGYPVTFLLPDEDCAWCPDWVSALILHADDFTLQEASK